MENEYAKFISETVLDWRIPQEAQWEGSYYRGDLTKKPEILLSMGYLPVEEDDGEIPEQTEKKHLEERYRLEETRIVRYYVLVDDPPRNLSLSKRKLMNNLKSRGIWTQVKAFMEQNGYWDDWDASTTLDEQEEMMQAAVAALKSAFQMSDESVEEIIAGSAAE